MDTADEHVGCGVAGAEEIDWMVAGKREGGNSDACGSGAADALELFGGADVVLVVLSDVVFYGGGCALSVFE
jgi:hypothetical protein